MGWDRCPRGPGALQSSRGFCCPHSRKRPVTASPPPALTGCAHCRPEQHWGLSRTQFPSVSPSLSMLAMEPRAGQEPRGALPALRDPQGLRSRSWACRTAGFSFA